MAQTVTKKNSKVLFVCQHYWPEAFRINDIADFFMERGDVLDVLCGIPNYPTGTFTRGYSFWSNRKQQHNGATIRRVLEIPRGSNTNARVLINYLSFPFFSLFHIPRLLTKKYDKIFLYQLSPVMMSVAGIVVGKLKKTETTMYVLDLWPENLFSVLNIKNPLLRRSITSISHWHYRHVDKLVVLSEQMRNRLIEITGIAAEKIIILPQACEKVYELEVTDNALAKRFEGGFNILYAGNISPAQSFETMIAAAGELKKAGLSDVKWIIVGDGMSRASIESQVKKARLSDCFYFEGQKPIEAIPAYSGIADVLVGCLVKSELLEATIPAKVMSYIASGKPMVLAMDGEVQKLVNGEIKCGFVGPTSDALALAANIRRVIALSPVERLEMGKRGRAYHLKHFERNIILTKLHNFIFS